MSSGNPLPVVRGKCPSQAFFLGPSARHPNIREPSMAFCLPAAGVLVTLPPLQKAPLTHHNWVNGNNVSLAHADNALDAFIVVLHCEGRCLTSNSEGTGVGMLIYINTFFSYHLFLSSICTYMYVYKYFIIGGHLIFISYQGRGGGTTTNASFFF